MRLNINSSKLNNPLYAVQWPIRGLFLLMKPGLRRFIWGPLFINFVLFSLAYWIAMVYFSDLLSWLIPNWLQWLEWLLWPLFFLSLLLLTFVTFTLIANILAAPFYGMLAKKAEALFIGGTPVIDEPASSLYHNVSSSMGSELIRLIYFILRALPILILFIIPGINIIAPILWFMFSGWFLALEYGSYPLEQKGLLFTEQRMTLNKFRLGAIAFGCISMLGLTVPLLNIFVPPASVVGATAYLLSGIKE